LRHRHRGVRAGLGRGTASRPEDLRAAAEYSPLGVRVRFFPFGFRTD